MTNLPIHKRINWQLELREHKRALFLIWFAFTFGLLVALILVALSVIELRADGHFTKTNIRLEQMQLAAFGAPGYTRTDFTEGTGDLKLRRIK